MNKTFKYSGVFILVLLTFLFAATCVYAEYIDVDLKDDGTIEYFTDAPVALFTAAYDPSCGSFKAKESLEGNKPDKDALYKIFALDTEHGWTPLCDSLSVLTTKGGDIDLSGSYDIIVISGNADIKSDICARYKLYICDGAEVSVSGSLTFGDDSPFRYVDSTVKGGTLTVKENGALIVSERTRLECETNVFLEKGSELKVLADSEFFIDDNSPYVLDSAGDITVEGWLNAGDWSRHFHGHTNENGDPAGKLLCAMYFDEFAKAISGRGLLPFDGDLDKNTYLSVLGERWMWHFNEEEPENSDFSFINGYAALIQNGILDTLAESQDISFKDNEPLLTKTLLTEALSAAARKVLGLSQNDALDPSLTEISESITLYDDKYLSVFKADENNFYWENDFYRYLDEYFDALTRLIPASSDDATSYLIITKRQDGFENVISYDNTDQIIRDFNGTNVSSVSFENAIDLYCAPPADGGDWGGRVRFINCDFASGLTVHSVNELSFGIDFDDSCSGGVTITSPAEYSYNENGEYCFRVNIERPSGMTFETDYYVHFSGIDPALPPFTVNGLIIDGNESDYDLEVDARWDRYTFENDLGQEEWGADRTLQINVYGDYIDEENDCIKDGCKPVLVKSAFEETYNGKLRICGYIDVSEVRTSGEGRIEVANDTWRSYVTIGANTIYVFEDVNCDCFFTCDSKTGAVKCFSDRARIYLNDFFAGDGTYVLRENEHGEDVFFIGIYNADTSMVNGDADLSLFLGDDALKYNVEKKLFDDGTYDLYLVGVPENDWIDEHSRPVRLIIDTGSGLIIYDDIMREWERRTNVIELTHKIRRVLGENGVELSSNAIPEKFLSAANLPGEDDDYPYEGFKFFLTYDTSDYFSLKTDGDNSYIEPDMWYDLRCCTAVSFIKDVLRAVKGEGYNANAADKLLRLYDEFGEERNPSEYINQGDLDHLVFDIFNDLLGDKIYVNTAGELSDAQSVNGDIVVCESFEVADDIVINPGRTLTVPESVTLTINGGSLKFKGQTSDGTVYYDTESSAENPGFYNHDVYSLFENRGTVNILNGSVTLEKCSSLDNYGTVDLNGGKLITLDGERRYSGFYKVENGVIETTGPDENGEYKVVLYDSSPDYNSYDHSTVNYCDYNDYVSAYVNNQGSINVNHGTIETGGYGYFLNDGFILIAESGEFRVKCYVDTNGDIINHGSVLLEDYGIIDQKGFVLNGGTTTLEDESLYSVNVFYDEEGQNNAAATLINEGTITAGNTSILNISAFKNDEEEIQGTLVNYGTTILYGRLEVFGSFVKESGSVLVLNDGSSVYIDEHGMFMAGAASDEDYASAVSDTNVNSCGVHYSLNIAESSSRFDVIYVFKDGALSVTNGAVLNVGLIVNEGKISIEDGAAINAGKYIENGGSVTQGAVNVN